MVSDFNIRDALWEKVFPVWRDSIAEELESGCLVILNTGTPTRIPDVAGHSPTAIDLSLASDSLVGISDWQVGDDPMGSDHLPITITLSIAPTKAEGPSKPRYIYERADWEGFQSYLESVLLTHTPSPDPEEEVNCLTSYILEAADHSIPKTGKRSRHRPVPWWTPA